MTSSILPTLLLLMLLGVAQSFSLVPTYQRRVSFVTVVRMSGSTQTSAGPNIEVVSQPDQEFLEKKDVFSWGTWGCAASKFPWTYDSSESCYLLAGKVTVTPTDGRPSATFGKGDFATFPSGMSCTWDVSEPVKKHFMFF